MMCTNIAEKLTKMKYINSFKKQMQVKQVDLNGS